MAAKAEPWERQPGESAKAFEAFRIYCEMQEERSVRAVGQRLVKSGSLISRWSSQYNWVERARAYDNHLLKERTLKAKKAQRDMNRRHIGIAGRLQQKALDVLDQLSNAEFEPRDVVEFFKLGAELERLSRRCEVLDGEPEDIFAMADLQQRAEDRKEKIREFDLNREDRKAANEDDDDLAAAWLEAVINTREENGKEPTV